MCSYSDSKDSKWQFFVRFATIHTNIGLPYKYVHICNTFYVDFPLFGIFVMKRFFYFDRPRGVECHKIILYRIGEVIKH